MEVSQHQGYHFGGPYDKDYSILGSILGYPNFGELPYKVLRDPRDVVLLPRKTS